MGRNAFLIFISVCILASPSVQARAGNVEVVPAAAGVVRAEPRQVVTTAFRVTNIGTEKRQFLARATLPPDWQLVTKELPFELPPAQTDVRLVSFFTPRTALAATYHISYSVTDTAAPSITDTSTITVLVPPVAGLSASLLQAPQYVIAGENCRVSFAVMNQGNSPSTVALNVKSSHDFPAQIDAETIQLAPGDSKKVTVTVTTNAEIRTKVRHRLKLTATSPGPENQQVSASARSFVEVIPRITGIDDPFHRLPVRVSLRGLFQRNLRTQKGLQAELAGSGTLDELGKKHLDFLFRGPDLERKSILGEHDEYRLSYQTEKYGVHLGDRGYSLSPLTELFQYGRGAEGRLSLGRFNLGAYHEQSRWLQPKQEQTAAYLSYLINGNYQFTLNYLKKNDSES